MAIALRYAEAELQPQPKRARLGVLASALLFAAAVFGVTLTLLTIF